MINANRIVPVQSTDLLSLYATMLKVAQVSVTKLSATNPGEFTVATDNTTTMCDEPLKTLNFGSAVSAGKVYFVAAYDFEGFSINGVKTAVTGVTPDAATLYSATLSSGSITIAKVGL